MKMKMLALVIAIAMLTGLIFINTVSAAGAVLITRQLGWQPLRTAVTTDDTVLDGTTTGRTYRFEDRPSTAKATDTELNRIEITFYGIDANTADGNDATVNFKLYAYRTNGPARLVYAGTATLGTAKASATEYYADTITGTAYWLTTVYIVDGAVGNNRVASLLFDLAGYQYVYLEIDIPAAASNPVSSISSDISGF